MRYRYFLVFFFGVIYLNFRVGLYGEGRDFVLFIRAFLNFGVVFSDIAND